MDVISCGFVGMYPLVVVELCMVLVLTYLELCSRFVLLSWALGKPYDWGLEIIRATNSCLVLVTAIRFELSLCDTTA